MNIPLELATGSTKKDVNLLESLRTPMDNLLTYFQTNAGVRLRWSVVQKLLKKDGAQTKDVKTSNLPRIAKLFPIFQFTDSSGAFIRKGSKGPYYVAIPASHSGGGGTRALAKPHLGSRTRRCKTRVPGRCGLAGRRLGTLPRTGGSSGGSNGRPSNTSRSALRPRSAWYARSSDARDGTWNARDGTWNARDARAWDARASSTTRARSLWSAS